MADKVRRTTGRRKKIKPDDAREYLRATAEFLSKVPYASKRLLFVATAFQEYLDGKYKTLDRALGLSPGRGEYVRPTDKKHLEMVRKAVRMIFDGKPFKTIAELQGYSEREFKRLYTRYSPQVIQEIVGKEMSFSEIYPDDGGA